MLPPILVYRQYHLKTWNEIVSRTALQCVRVPHVDVNTMYMRRVVDSPLFASSAAGPLCLCCISAGVPCVAGVGCARREQFCWRSSSRSSPCSTFPSSGPFSSSTSSCSSSSPWKNKSPYLSFFTFFTFFTLLSDYILKVFIYLFIRDSSSIIRNQTVLDRLLINSQMKR